MGQAWRKGACIQDAQSAVGEDVVKRDEGHVVLLGSIDKFKWLVGDGDECRLDIAQTRLLWCRWCCWAAVRRR